MKLNSKFIQWRTEQTLLFVLPYYVDYTFFFSPFLHVNLCDTLLSIPYGILAMENIILQILDQNVWPIQHRKDKVLVVMMNMS